MVMLIAHIGRTGKRTDLTFNTEKKTYCLEYLKHDVFIYAEQTKDVRGVLGDLKRLGYTEVTAEELLKAA